MTYVLSFDSEKQIKAKKYFYSSLLSSITKKALVSILTLSAILLHIPIIFYNFVETYPVIRPYVLTIFILLGYGLFLIITLPFSYFSEYSLERKYSLSNKTKSEWLHGKIRSSAIILILALAIIELGYNFTSINPTWILAGLGVIIVFIITISLTSPAFIEKNIYDSQQLQDKELLSRISSLALKSGLKKIQVFVMQTNKTSKVAAESSGTAGGRKISLSDTMLKSYSHDEIESIVGHELGHHKNGHILKSAFLMSIVAGVAFIGAYRITDLTGSLIGLGSADSITALPLLILVFSLICFAFTPLLNAFSRWTERKCDEYELKLVGKPNAYVSSIVKLTDHNLRYASPNRLIELLFFDHPSSEKRIRYAL